MKIIAEILSIVILLAGMASCAKTDRLYDDDRTEIAMRPVMSVMPKAPVTGTEYPAGASFGVNAYYSSDYSHGQEWTDVTSQPYFENRKFAQEGDTFSGSPKCYWPHQGSLVFAGYSPFNAKKESVTFDPVEKTLTITGFESDGQTDLMYFLPEVSDDKLVGINSGASSVPAVFSHALTLLEFNIYGLEGDETIKITKVTVSDWRSQGNFSVTVGAEPEWTLPENNATQDMHIYTHYGEVISDENPITIHALAIPGATTDITITITYDIYAAQTHTGKTATITAAEITEFTTWATGKKYIYDITISSKFIVVDPSVGNFNGEWKTDIPTLG